MKPSNFSKTIIGLHNYLKYAFVLSLSLLIISVSKAQSNAIFGYLNQANSSELKLNHLVEGDNDQFYVIGYDYPTSESFLFRCDQDGNMVWQKKLALSAGVSAAPSQLGFYNNHIYVLMIANGFDLDSSVVDTSDPDTSSISSYVNYLLAKIDVNGNLIWTKTIHPLEGYTYHQPSMDFGPAGEIIVASSSYGRIEFFSLNQDGSTNWIRNCNSDSTQSKNPNFDIATCDNGDIMGCSKAGSYMCFYRMSSTGIPIWSKTIADATYTHIKSIRQIGTNLFIACGYSGFGFYTLMDGSGNFISFNRVNELSEIRNIFPLDNGNFLLVGITSGAEFALIEINSAGTILNSNKTIDSPISPTAYEGVIEMNGYLYIGDGKYIQKLDNIVPTECFNYQPTTFSLTGDDPSAYPMTNNFAVHATTGSIVNNTTIHLDPSNITLAHGCGLTSGIPNTVESNIKVYPTLLNNNESIFIEHEMTSEVHYLILDINGKMVEQNVLTNSSVMINGMSAGMYVLQLTNNGNVVYYSKFVVN